MLARTLPRPINRVGFLLLVAGFALVLLGAATTRVYWGDSVAEYLFDAMIEWGHPFDRYAKLRFGGWLVVVGFCLSFAYPFTIGPLLRWIRYGSSRT